jgi:hypothetical protein
MTTESKSFTPDEDGVVQITVGDSEPMEFSVEAGEEVEIGWSPE